MKKMIMLTIAMGVVSGKQVQAMNLESSVYLVSSEGKEVWMPLTQSRRLLLGTPEKRHQVNMDKDAATLVAGRIDSDLGTLPICYYSSKVPKNQKELGFDTLYARMSRDLTFASDDYNYKIVTPDNAVIVQKSETERRQAGEKVALQRENNVAKCIDYYKHQDAFFLEIPQHIQKLGVLKMLGLPEVEEDCAKSVADLLDIAPHVLKQDGNSEKMKDLFAEESPAMSDTVLKYMKLAHKDNAAIAAAKNPAQIVCLQYLDMLDADKKEAAIQDPWIAKQLAANESSK